MRVTLATLVLLAVSAVPTRSQQPTEAQLDSMMNGTLEPEELVFRALAQPKAGRCESGLDFHRLDVGTGVSWQIGWYDGVEEVDELPSKLDWTWVDLEWLPNWMFMRKGGEVRQMMKDMDDLIDSLEALYQERGKRERYFYLIGREILCRTGGRERVRGG